MSIYLKTN